MGRGTPRHRQAARPQAARALRRREAARRARPRHRPRAGRLPAGRAALEPGRQAARVGPGGARAVSRERRDDDDLRDARPDRGDGDGRPDRRDELRPGPPDRIGRRGLRRSGRHVRRDLSRVSSHESRRAGRRHRGLPPGALLPGHAAGGQSGRPGGNPRDRPGGTVRLAELPGQPPGVPGRGTARLREPGGRALRWKESRLAHVREPCRPIRDGKPARLRGLRETPEVLRPGDARNAPRRAATYGNEPNEGGTSIGADQTRPWRSPCSRRPCSSSCS